jgi:hypothetical protein
MKSALFFFFNNNKNQNKQNAKAILIIFPKKEGWNHHFTLFQREKWTNKFDLL